VASNGVAMKINVGWRNGWLKVNIINNENISRNEKQ
jgi:hypothetical protein